MFWKNTKKQQKETIAYLNGQYDSLWENYNAIWKDYFNLSDELHEAKSLIQDMDSEIIFYIEKIKVLEDKLKNNLETEEYDDDCGFVPDL